MLAQNISLGGEAADELDEQPTAIRPSNPAVEALKRAALERGLPPPKPAPANPDMGEDVPTDAPKRATGARPALAPHGILVGQSPEEKALAAGQEKIITSDLEVGEDAELDAVRGVSAPPPSEVGLALGAEPEEDTAVRRAPVVPELPPEPPKRRALTALGVLLVMALSGGLGFAVWLKSQGRWPPPELQAWLGPLPAVEPAPDEADAGEGTPAPAPGEAPPPGEAAPPSGEAPAGEGAPAQPEPAAPPVAPAVEPEVLVALPAAAGPEDGGVQNPAP